MTTRGAMRKTLRGIYKKLYKFYGPQGWWPATSRLEVIVGAILTQNTAWSNVEKAINNLKTESLLSRPTAIQNIPGRSLARLIRPAGYYNIKAKRLKNFMNFLADRYDADLDIVSRRKTETLRREFLAVNGIGPETCDSILLYAFKRPIFVVDAYTKRVFSRHGFFDENEDYHYIQAVFMDNIGPDHKIYNEYHALIVRLCKQACRKDPDCGICPLKNIKLPCK